MRAIISCLYASCVVADYAFDSTWKPEFPKGSKGFATVGVSHGTVFIGSESGGPVYVFDSSGKFKNVFGKGDVGKAHGLRIHRNASGADTVWVTDMKAGKVVAFTLEGKKLASFGSKGGAKGQFVAPADVAFRGSAIYVADGDSGSGDNRVTAWKLDESGLPTEELWATPPEFKSPHSICLHEQMDKLIVANRFAGNIKIVDPDTGKDEGTLSCDALSLNAKTSKPYGVRMIGNTLFVVSGPKDGAIHIVDYPSGMQCGKLLQTIHTPHDCSTPHLLGIDQDTEDVYVACLTGTSTVLRLTKKGSATVVV